MGGEDHVEYVDRSQIFLEEWEVLDEDLVGKQLLVLLV